MDYLGYENLKNDNFEPDRFSYKAQYLNSES